MDAHKWRSGGPSTKTQEGGRTDGGAEALPFLKRKCSTAGGGKGKSYQGNGRLEERENGQKMPVLAKRLQTASASSGSGTGRPVSDTPSSPGLWFPKDALAVCLCGFFFTHFSH